MSPINILNFDIHRFDEDGFLYIGGRQKEIIVTGGGENVAPVPIEEMIKVQLKDILSNAIPNTTCTILGTIYTIPNIKYNIPNIRCR